MASPSEPTVPPSRTIVFLLDVSHSRSVTQEAKSPAVSDPQSYSEKLASAVQRLLDYHSSCSNCALQWAYHLFDSDSCFLSLRSRNIPLRDFTPDTVKAFRHKLSRRVSEASSGNSRPYKDEYAAITNALSDTLRDVDWTPGSFTLSLDSLLWDDDDHKEADVAPCQKGHPLTSRLYLFADAPDSVQALGACKGAAAFLNLSQNGPTEEDRQPKDLISVTSKVQASAPGRRGPRLTDSFSRTLFALTKRLIGLVWVDSKPNLIGMNSAERSQVISAFSRWLSSHASDASLLDINSLFLDPRIVSPIAVIERQGVDGHVQRITRNEPISENRNQRLHWFLTDVLVTNHPSPSSPSVKSNYVQSGSPLKLSKCPSTSPSRQTSTSSFCRYFRAQMSSSCMDGTPAMKSEEKADVHLDPAQHFLLILRGLRPDKISNDDLCSMRAFESSAQILRPAGHCGSLSPLDAVTDWTSLFAGLMSDLFRTRRTLVADVCVRGSEHSGSVKTLYTVLIRPMTALLASVRKIALDEELSRIRVPECLPFNTVFGDEPGSLLVPNLHCLGASETLPEEQFDCYMACGRNNMIRAAETKDFPKNSPVQNSLRALVQRDPCNSAPSHLLDKQEIFSDLDMYLGSRKERLTKKKESARSRLAKRKREFKLIYKPTSATVGNKGSGANSHHVPIQPMNSSTSVEAMPSLEAHHATEDLSHQSSKEEADSLTRNNYRVVPQNVTLTEPMVAECHTNAPKWQIHDALTPEHSFDLDHKLISPVTAQPDGKTPCATQQADSRCDRVETTLLLRVATDRFTSHLFEDVDAGQVKQHLHDSLRNLESIVQILSDKHHFRDINMTVIQGNLREDSDVLSDLDASQKRFRQIDKSSSASSTILSTIWKSMLVAFGQVVWLVAEFGFGNAIALEHNSRSCHFRDFAERSLAILSCTQMMGEVTATLPEAHSLFHDAFTHFFSSVLIHFFKGSGALTFRKLVKKIFAGMDQKIRMLSPCVRTESKTRKRHPSAPPHGRDFRHGEGPCIQQSSYKKLVKCDSAVEEKSKNTDPGAVSGSFSSSSHTFPKVHTFQQNSEWQKGKRSVRRALFEENRAERTSKRQKTIPIKKKEAVVADARKKRPVVSSVHISQLSANIVELQTAKRRRRSADTGKQNSATDSTGNKVKRSRLKSKNITKDSRNNKLVAVAATTRLRRSPRNRKQETVDISKASMETIGSSDGAPESQTPPDYEISSKTLPAASELQAAGIALDLVVPATPIRKKKSQRKLTSDWSTYPDSRVTRTGAKKLEMLRKQGGIPQSPG